MNRILAIAQSVVADAIRRKVVWAVLVFAAILALAIPSLPSYGVGVVSAVYREVSIALMFAAAAVVSIALAATRLPSEIERRTVFNVISRDVRRWEYVLGTWLGMFIVVGASILAFTVAAIGFGAIQYHETMYRLFEAAFAVWLEMGVVIAFTVMMSALFGVVTSVVATLAFLFIGHATVSLLRLAENVRAPWWFPTLSTFDVINPVAHGSGYGPLYATSMVVTFVAWVAILLLFGSLLFGSRDL